MTPGGRDKPPADVDRLAVERKPAVDLAQIDELLTQVLQVVAVQHSIFVIIGGPRDRKLLLLDCSLEYGYCLEVVAQLVMEVAQAIQASAERTVMPCHVRMGLDKFFEDVDSRLK